MIKDIDLPILVTDSRYDYNNDCEGCFNISPVPVFTSKPASQRFSIIVLPAGSKRSITVSGTANTLKLEKTTASGHRANSSSSYNQESSKNDVKFEGGHFGSFDDDILDDLSFDHSKLSTTAQGQGIKLPENFNKSPKEGFSYISTPKSVCEETENLQNKVPIESTEKVTRRKLSLIHPPTPKIVDYKHLNPILKKSRDSFEENYNSMRTVSSKSLRKVRFSTKKQVILIDHAGPLLDRQKHLL